MKKEIKQEDLAKAKNIVNLRRRGVKVNDIMNSMGLTYAEYKKLEQLGKEVKNQDVNLIEEAIKIAEYHTKEELFALSYYMMQMALFR